MGEGLNGFHDINKSSQTTIYNKGISFKSTFVYRITFRVGIAYLTKQKH